MCGKPRTCLTVALLSDSMNEKREHFHCVTQLSYSESQLAARIVAGAEKYKRAYKMFSCPIGWRLPYTLGLVQYLPLLIPS